MGGGEWALSGSACRACAYGLLNIVSTVAIVMVNKLVYTVCQFNYPVALTFIHTVVTWIGIQVLAKCGAFEGKAVPKRWSLLIGAAHGGSVVLNNMSLQLNTVGFYQISKIALTPAVLLAEAALYGRRISTHVMAAVGVLLTGVVLASISDPQVTSNPIGVMVALMNIVVATVHAVWTGSIQLEVGVNGNQLLLAMAPYSVLVLAPAVPLLEPLGLFNPTKETILGYSLTIPSAMWILLSAVLGLVVSQSVCLFIGATSGSTYAVVGHTKTLLIVMLGVQHFGDTMTVKKVAGLCLAVGGMVWYSHAKHKESTGKKVVQPEPEALEDKQPLLPIAQLVPQQLQTSKAKKPRKADIAKITTMLLEVQEKDDVVPQRDQGPPR